MNGKRILISAAYLELLKQAMKPGDIFEASDFAKFLSDLKWRLKNQGHDELFNNLIREEIHMFESSDRFV